MSQEDLSWRKDGQLRRMRDLGGGVRRDFWWVGSGLTGGGACRVRGVLGRRE